MSEFISSDNSEHVWTICKIWKTVILNTVHVNLDITYSKISYHFFSSSSPLEAVDLGSIIIINSLNLRICCILCKVNLLVWCISCLISWCNCYVIDTIFLKELFELGYLSCVRCKVWELHIMLNSVDIYSCTLQYNLIRWEECLINYNSKCYIFWSLIVILNSRKSYDRCLSIKYKCIACCICVTALIFCCHFESVFSIFLKEFRHWIISACRLNIHSLEKNLICAVNLLIDSECTAVHIVIESFMNYVAHIYTLCRCSMISRTCETKFRLCLIYTEGNCSFSALISGSVCSCKLNCIICLIREYLRTFIYSWCGYTLSAACRGSLCNSHDKIICIFVCFAIAYSNITVNIKISRSSTLWERCTIKCCWKNRCSCINCKCYRLCFSSKSRLINCCNRNSMSSFIRDNLCCLQCCTTIDYCTIIGYCNILYIIIYNNCINWNTCIVVLSILIWTTCVNIVVRTVVLIKLRRSSCCYL